MTLVPMNELPDSARLWVFGAERPLSDEAVARLEEVTDDFLRSWTAHGTPLAAGRELHGDRFLLVAVDEERAPPSGCSIDALVRSLKGLEKELGVALVGKAPVWYEDEGRIRSVTRLDFAREVSEGALDGDTVVFDLTLTRLGDLREGRFRLPARESWHRTAFLSEET